MFQTDVSVGVSRLCVGFGQVCEETLVADEAGKVSAAVLNAYRASGSETVCVDKRKMVSAVHFVEKNVACREVAVKKAVVVKAGGETCKTFCDLMTFFFRQLHDLRQGIAVG